MSLLVFFDSESGHLAFLMKGRTAGVTPAGSAVRRSSFITLRYRERLLAGETPAVPVGGPDERGPGPARQLGSAVGAC